MKKSVLLVFVLFLVLGCSKPGDCIEPAGNLITKEFDVSQTFFDKVIVYKGVALVITDGPEYKVTVKTGENLMDNVEVKVENGRLAIKDNTSCNLVRDYGLTTVYVTAPNLTEIHSKTEQDIVSNGVLTYPILRLFSIDLTDGAGTNDFKLQVDNGQLVIENNNVSRYYISGKTNHLIVGFYDGNGRFEGPNLHAKLINIYHRGSNDIIVYPIDEINGEMVSTGNLIIKNTPPVDSVKELFRGRKIYN
jgi:hypothetical protein